MRGYILSHGLTLPPFGTPVGEAWVLDGTLREAQERALQALGCKIAHLALAPGQELPDLPGPGPALLLEEDTYASPGALRAFVAAARLQSAAVGLGLVAGPVTEWCGVLGGAGPAERGLVRQGVVWLPEGLQPPSRVALAGLPLLPVDPGGQQATFPAPRGAAVAELKVPAPARLVLAVRHWVHLLLANLLGFSAGVQDAGPWRTGLRVLGAALRARSLDPHAIAARLNRMGRRCLIHPRAVVEGCLLGDRVRVGANAVLQGCVLGDDVIVEELASATLSVLGDGARLQRCAIMRFSTAFPGAEVAGSIQLSVVGRGASIKHAAYTLDMSLGSAPIRCWLDGRLAEAGLPFLGACLGHEAVVGSGVWLAPGREVPNGCWLIQPPGLAALRIPQDLAPQQAAWVEHGTVVQAAGAGARTGGESWCSDRASVLRPSAPDEPRKHEKA